MRSFSLVNTIATTAVAASLLASPAQAEEAEDFAKFYFSPALGLINFEGDQPLDDGFYLNLRLGYDMNEWWSLEGGLLYAPSLDENFVTGAGAHIFYDKENDRYIEDKTAKKSCSKGSDSHFGDTWMASIYGDALFHFTRWERLDPFLTVGLGLNMYGQDVLASGNKELVVRSGAGIMYHFDDEWAIRGDFRLLVDTEDIEFNNSLEIGIAWFWGAGSEPEMFVNDGPIDSDGDGLFDDYEIRIGTDPYNPDTDGDGLKDGEEVLTYKTDPLNPDSDYDGLKDGEEVLTYKTDPLDPDTDKGGVKDGHEVHTDKTNPLNGNDDFLRFELHLLFDYDKAVIHQKDYAELDVIAKVLAQNPQASATIEGHADRLTRSKAAYNRNLSKRRADAVRQYLINKGISADRLQAEGYGFDRPQVKPDLINGTPENRRVEVYVRGVTDRQISDTLKNK